MASPPSCRPRGHGDAWPGPDRRSWTQSTLFDSTFVRREPEPPPPGDGEQAAMDLSPSLLGVPLSPATPQKRAASAAAAPARAAPVEAAPYPNLACSRKPPNKVFQLRIGFPGDDEVFFVPEENVFSLPERKTHLLGSRSIRNLCVEPENALRKNWIEDWAKILQPDALLQLVIGDRKFLCVNFALEESPDEEQILRAVPARVVSDVFGTLYKYRFTPPSERNKELTLEDSRLHRRWRVCNCPQEYFNTLTPEDVSSWPRVPKEERVRSAADPPVVECAVCFTEILTIESSDYGDYDDDDDYEGYYENGTSCHNNHPLCFACTAKLTITVGRKRPYDTGIGMRCPTCREHTSWDRDELIAILAGSRKHLREAFAAD